MNYRLVVTEKPSVAMSIAAALGVKGRGDGYMEGGGWLISWCVGHLAELSDAAAYAPRYAKWRREDLPILPENWRFTIGQDKRGQFDTLRELLRREDVSEVVNACDAGREGELIFRTVYHLAGCTKPMKRLWISSMEDTAIEPEKVDDAASQESPQPPDLSGQPITRKGDTITIGNGDDSHEVDITVSDEEWQTIQEVIGAADQPPQDPLTPAYKVGDTVYLNNTAFEITNVGMLIAKRLSDAFASRAETVTLETRDIADYFTSTISMEVEIQDKFGTKLALSWETVAPILWALYQQELDGFTHEPAQREPVELEGRLSYQVGDKVAFSGGDHDVVGTIESIGDFEVHIHTGPYAWSHETVSKDFFENAVRHDERNAGLFTPEVPAAEVSDQPAPSLANEAEAPPQTSGPTVTPGAATIYPGDKNGLPYDVVFQTLHIDEPEQSQPEQAPATENFCITDDHLGEGGAKVKFRRNMEAINTLQAIELEGRTATPEEQELLSRYVGWGGLPDAFDPGKPSWANEFLELQAALTPEEYASARASTLNAHYTSPTVIKAIYEAIEKMGFKTGNVLEPSCGIGNFFGLLPESMAASKFYGVELDSITGRIARQLYPKANSSIQGFEKTGFPDGFFDLAIGNVPFGGYKVADRRYDKENLLIHDYFFAKTIDAVRSGGVIAFITSNGISGGTMDKKDRRARDYIARRCDLLGTVRLPSNASLANAGTEAGMDIVFLQKRDVPGPLTNPSRIGQMWICWKNTLTPPETCSRKTAL